MTVTILLSACSATATEIATDARADAEGPGLISDAAAEAVPFVCSVTAPTSCPDPPLHYPDVAPIFQLHCAVSCHSGVADGPWPLTSYEHVADWWDYIKADILECTMPPLDAGSTITTEERVAILTWLRCGFPP